MTSPPHIANNALSKLDAPTLFIMSTTHFLQQGLNMLIQQFLYCIHPSDSASCQGKIIQTMKDNLLKVFGLFRCPEKPYLLLKDIYLNPPYVYSDKDICVSKYCSS